MGAPFQQPQLNGAYSYDQAQSGMGAGPSGGGAGGTFPGAQPPPGWQAPPPGPFANWMNPMMASMIGRAGSAPPGMNAYNPGNNTWGNIDWFPGIPRSGG
jgi:hypothetical protein